MKVPEARRYILGEYGSWGVLLMSSAAGIAASGRAGLASLSAFLGVCLAVNSKQAFAIWNREKASGVSQSAVIFFVQAVAASVILMASLGRSLLLLLPAAAVPLLYFLSLRLKGEHALITEASGFMSLALASLAVRAASDDQIDYRLYAAVAAFFVAGVFRVRLQLKKTSAARNVLALYVVGAALLYYCLGLPLLLLVPLLDDLVFAILVYKVGLKATGRIEMLKGIAFVAIMASRFSPLR